jgi:hypothetical protein
MLCTGIPHREHLCNGSGFVVAADVQKLNFDLLGSALRAPRSGNGLQSPQPYDPKGCCN